MLRINLGMAAAVLLLAGVCRAETPAFGGDTQAMSMVQRGRLFMGGNWWSRYGEPVNAVALDSAGTSPSDKGMIGGPVPMHGDGYVFAPGSCDCPPPCIWDLWTGYVQNPKRCHPHGLRCGGCGLGHGGCCCKLRCGGGCNAACGAPVPSCAAPNCGAPLSCSAVVSDCGCKPVCGKCRHFHRGHGFLAHWHRRCDSCAAPIGCGCATPVLPGISEKQAIGAPPKPLPEDAALLALPRLR
jgi:hypothetical protein